MEHTFSSREKGFGFWDSPRSQMEGLTAFGSGARNSVSEDVLSNTSELMNLDPYAGWRSSPSSTDLLPQHVLFTSQSMPPSSFNALIVGEKKAAGILGFNDSYVEGYYGGGEKLLMPQMGSQFCCPLDSTTDTDEPSGKCCSGTNWKNNLPYGPIYTIPRSLRHSLDEKMLKALSLFMESTGEGILAQVWIPIKMGDQYMLSTCDQAYLLDQRLSGYREASRKFTFSAEPKQGSFPGLPGRVFISGAPEWTSNVVYYNAAEFLRMKHAIDNEVRGSIALPILEASETSRCAVLELVTNIEKQDFAMEMKSVCNALQAVNLHTVSMPRLQHPSSNQRAALAEIKDVLRAVCHAHRLPLALTWIPCSYSKGAKDESIKAYRPNSDGHCVLCVEETACYVIDTEMEGFVHACSEHYLEEGKGIAGKALLSNQPFFCSNVKTYDTSEYPLVQHARKYGLNAAVAIRLRSTYTGSDDYVLEIFLPLYMKGSSEQQLLLDNLSGTMQRVCKSLRTVSDAESLRRGYTKAGFQKENMSCFPETAVSRGNNVTESQETSEQAISGSGRLEKRKKSATEKNVSLSVLQQYFSGSLKDAAKSIGVCPTTLKRICRQHGIMRWPSRKINKVNRSLQKIQTVLDSVQRINGGLKFDPTRGEFIASGPSTQDFDTQKNQSPHNNATAVKLEEDENSADTNQAGLGKNCGSENQTADRFLDSGDLKMNSATSLLAPWSSSPQGLEDDMDTRVECDDGVIENNQSISGSMSGSSADSGAVVIKSPPTSMENRNQMKTHNSSDESGSALTIKSTYGEDTVRFKFEPSAGCFQLYKEVGRRFKLQDGMFQLKYLDDEEEWVMLVTDSDLQECLEILENMGKHTVKFLVHDLPGAIGSSASSNSYLETGL